MPIEKRSIVLWFVFAVVLGAAVSADAAGEVRVWEEDLTLPT